MADTKKRGFHALEQRIHEMEEEDAKQEKNASSQEKGGAPRTSPPQDREQQVKKS